jgi:hypothetical protein
MSSRPKKHSLTRLIKRLKEVFADLPQCQEVDLKEAYYLEDRRIRVPNDGAPIHFIVGKNGKHLDLYPERPLSADESTRLPPPSSYILFDPDHYFSSVSGFLRLTEANKITIDPEDPLQQALFDYPQEVDPHHFSIKYQGKKLVFRDHSTGTGTCVIPLLKNKERNCLAAQRRKNLQQLRRLIGGPIKPQPRDDALDSLRQVNKILSKEKYRLHNADDQPGAVLKLPGKLTPILVADLHTKTDNLLNILSQSGFIEALEAGDACLIIIGDAPHSEVDGEMEDMDSSILLMDLILRLKLRFPAGVFYLRGNHDSFSERIAKSGIPQGLLWARALRNSRGKAYEKEMQRFYDQLPLLVYSKHFIACHAAPPTSKASLDDLIDAYNQPKLMAQLVTNRIYLPSRPGGYKRGDIKRLRKTLGVKPGTPFIVGHTPRDRDDTIWMNVAGFDNHHILFSAGETWAGAMTWINGQLIPLRYPVEPLLQLFNELPDTP